MYKHLAWLTDFSPHSALCIEPVCALARVYNASVSVVHALSGLEGLRLVAEEQLQGVAEQLRAHGLEVETRLEMGSPTDVARDPRADLLVVGRTGKTGLVDRLLVGSTAGRILRESPSDVLLVTGRPFSKLSSVLCALEPAQEGEEDANETARCAAELAILSGASCTFLSVFPYIETVDSEAEVASLHESVKAALGDADFDRIQATFEVGYAPSPEAGILDVARKHDLVVMGHRQQSRLVQAVWGSVTREVEERGPVPVLVAR